MALSKVQKLQNPYKHPHSPVSIHTNKSCACRGANVLFLGEQPVAGLLVSQVIVSAFQGAVQTKTIRIEVVYF